eukprot:gnl/Chilomastix_cuspidata/3991.p1 GENE.gnl/Chilomastix_cuspidata/3991~~gnl/Chilomastix_cuspidata/3991.p1  ORF type:complete len:429 (+),score=191.29 gnl/Chilomastix_cuspidata/3991:244-1530(+)
MSFLFDSSENSARSASVNLGFTLDLNNNKHWSYAKKFPWRTSCKFNLNMGKATQSKKLFLQILEHYSDNICQISLYSKCLSHQFELYFKKIAACVPDIQLVTDLPPELLPCLSDIFGDRSIRFLSCAQLGFADAAAARLRVEHVDFGANELAFSHLLEQAPRSPLVRGLRYASFHLSARMDVARWAARVAQLPGLVGLSLDIPWGQSPCGWFAALAEHGVIFSRLRVYASTFPAELIPLFARLLLHEVYVDAWQRAPQICDLLRGAAPPALRRMRLLLFKSAAHELRQLGAVLARLRLADLSVGFNEVPWAAIGGFLEELFASVLTDFRFAWMSDVGCAYVPHKFARILAWLEPRLLHVPFDRIHFADFAHWDGRGIEDKHLQLSYFDENWAALQASRFLLGAHELGIGVSLRGHRVELGAPSPFAME